MRLAVAFRSIGAKKFAIAGVKAFARDAVDERQLLAQKPARSKDVWPALADLALRRRLRRDAGFMLEGDGAAKLYSLYDELNRKRPRGVWFHDVVGLAEGPRDARKQAQLRTKYEELLERDISGKRPKVWLRSQVDTVIWLDKTPVIDDAVVEHLAEHFCGIESAFETPVQTAATNPLNVALIAGHFSYAREIVNGFGAQLRELGYKLDGDLDIGDCPAMDEPVVKDGSLSTPWNKYIERQIAGCGEGKCQYVISVGTPASTAVRAKFGDEYGVAPHCPPVVFAGVTYPRRSMLVECLTDRKERKDVTGVAYGAEGVNAVASHIRHLFPAAQRLKFVYLDDVVLDAQCAADLRETSFHENGTLTIARCARLEFAKELADPNLIYFSWLTLEMILSAGASDLSDLKDLLKGKYVIAATGKNCKQGPTLASVGADNKAIGRAAANIIHAREQKACDHFGRVSVELPHIEHCINQDVADELGHVFDDQVLGDAKEVYWKGRTYSGREFLDIRQNGGPS